MSLRSFRPTIIIPTKDRAQILAQLLDSIEQLGAIERILPEIIVADNDSRDNTYEHVNSKARCFPTTIRALKVRRPGKSAAINDAVHAATGNVLAFLDDDVVVDKTWLTSIEEFFQRGQYHVGQGIIRLQSPARDDPEIQKLVQRYRTIPKLEHDPKLAEVHSLNGSNFFVSRNVFDRVGGFDERLGPGASGTSEDVEFAHRLARSGIGIGYASKAVVYHHVDRNRLTDEYFKQSHWRQGRSRLLIRNRSAAEILFNLVHAIAQYALYTLLCKERNRYRSKGRIYHYLGMIEAKQNHVDHREER
ncbi:MAG TPA: glycosyltransferase [Verrucomicrobiae bacterium]|nr:glycosyltransferase [Verrucomicrobiae bacterium]